MTMNAVLQLILFLILLLLLSWPLGLYAARVYQGRPCGLDKVLGPLERLLYRLSGVDPDREMNWKTYALAMTGLNALGLLAVYGLQRLQGGLPLNPLGLPGVDPFVALNTAISFATNTNCFICVIKMLHNVVSKIRGVDYVRTHRLLAKQ